VKIGIDLGGTKIEAIVLSETGGLIWRHRTPTPQGNYQKTLAAISLLVTKARTENKIAATVSVGIGTPGAMTLPSNTEPSNTVSSFTELVMKNCNSTALNGQPLLKDLTELLNCPVYIANDANCFALAEALSGQGKRETGQGQKQSGQGQEILVGRTLESVFGVILGTGVGGGIVTNGKLLQGLNSISGEWGHNGLPSAVLALLPDSEKSRPCYCGRQDCIETYLSGPGLALSYRLRFNEAVNSESVIQKMRAGEAKAEEIWLSYLSQLGCALAQVVNILDPALIVLGGGLSSIDEIYLTLHDLMQPFVFSDTFDTPVLPALLGDSAGVYGAAWLNS